MTKIDITIVCVVLYNMPKQESSKCNISDSNRDKTTDLTQKKLFIILDNPKMAKMILFLYEKNRKLFKNTEFICLGPKIEESLIRKKVKYLDARDFISPKEIYNLEFEAHYATQNWYKELDISPICRMYDHALFQNIIRKKVIKSQIIRKINSQNQKIKVVTSHDFIKKIEINNISIKFKIFYWDMSMAYKKLMRGLYFILTDLTNYRSGVIKNKIKKKILDVNSTWRTAPPLQFLSDKYKICRFHYGFLLLLQLVLCLINKKQTRQIPDDLLDKGGEIPTEEKIKQLIKITFKRYGLDNTDIIQIYREHRRLFRETLCYYNIMNEFFKKNNFDCIYCPTSKMVDTRSIILVAKKRQIPTLVVQHGVIFLDHWYADVYEENKMAVWGNQPKNRLISLGANKEKLIVTGAPRFINYKKKKLTSRTAEEKMSILFTTDATLDETSMLTVKNIRSEVKSIIKQIKNRDRYKLIIKLHPLQESWTIMDLIEGNNVEIIKNKDIKGVILKSDILITKASTTALEAMLLGKPVIIINFHDEKQTLPFIETGAAVELKNSNKLITTIDEIFNNKSKYVKLMENQQKFLEENLSAYGEEGARNIANLIEKMSECTRRAK